MVHFRLKTKVIHIEQNRKLTLSTEAVFLRYLLFGLDLSLLKANKNALQHNWFHTNSFFIGHGSRSKYLHTSCFGTLVLKMLFSTLFICYFSDSESNCDPPISAGVGLSWSWTGALASAGPSLSACVTNTLLALWVSSSGGHTAAQGERRKKNHCLYLSFWSKFKETLFSDMKKCFDASKQEMCLVSRNRLTLCKLGWVMLNQS